MTGATGARAWLQAQHATWLTPPRVKAATVGVFAAAAIGSSVTLSGTTPAGSTSHPAAPAHHAPASR